MFVKYLTKLFVKSLNFMVIHATRILLCFKSQLANQMLIISGKSEKLTLGTEFLHPKDISWLSSFFSFFFFLFLSFFFFLLLFRAITAAYGSSLSNRSYSSRPTLQPQQHQTRATSVTYTTVHCNARSLTH